MSVQILQIFFIFYLHKSVAQDEGLFANISCVTSDQCQGWQREKMWVSWVELPNNHSAASNLDLQSAAFVAIYIDTTDSMGYLRSPLTKVSPQKVLITVDLYTSIEGLEFGIDLDGKMIYRNLDPPIEDQNWTSVSADATLEDFAEVTVVAKLSENQTDEYLAFRNLKVNAITTTTQPIETDETTTQPTETEQTTTQPTETEQTTSQPTETEQATTQPTATGQTTISSSSQSTSSQQMSVDSYTTQLATTDHTKNENSSKYDLSSSQEVEKTVFTSVGYTYTSDDSSRYGSSSSPEDERTLLTSVDNSTDNQKNNNSEPETDDQIESQKPGAWESFVARVGWTNVVLFCGLLTLSSTAVAAALPLVTKMWTIRSMQSGHIQEPEDFRKDIPRRFSIRSSITI